MPEIGKYYDLSDDITLGGNNPSDHIAVSQYAVKRGIDTILNNPFYLETRDDRGVMTLTVGSKSNPSSYTFQYSTNGGVAWNSVTFSDRVFEAKLGTGERIYIRGTNSTLSTGANESETFTINCDTPHSIGGDITTLLSPTGDVGTIPNYCFYGLFSDDVQLIDASRLTLPPTILGQYSYARMFYGCEKMAYGPRRLRNAVLGNYSCNAMFKKCGHLKSAPILEHQTATTGCYNEMFMDCGLLSYIRTELTNPSPNYSYDWVNNVNAPGLFYIDRHAQWPGGNDGVPNGWNVYAFND